MASKGATAQSEVSESDLFSMGHTPYADRPPAEPARCRPRAIEIRSVDIPCRDVGCPLMEITCLNDSFACLSSTRKILYHLHKAGWVHGDVGVATMRWIDKDGQRIGKLMDFEYAKAGYSSVLHGV
ncbi:hypothetical protein EV363DRAFT_1336639 [Boletus edulis]|uniref:Fungal-type protein kinase domain-containing protein n=1 Tax=Boletus edulis BED1 TaxID=1328754 RepID=A0AAD4BC86_BOLED|nr:hypothetical protein EV363DRAFT_1336639 [Boletus edulis]KAF8418477.1 hypothetical protein L210DRAFT_3579048 [Boletus edulis BED1]